MSQQPPPEKDIIMEIYATQAVHTAVLREIKEDIKTLGKRTYQNETAIDYIKKHVYYVQGALGLLTLAGTIIGILAYLGRIG